MNPTPHRPEAPEPARAQTYNQTEGRRLKKGELTKLFFFVLIMLGTGLLFVLTPNLMPSALISALLFFTFGPAIDAIERKGIPRGVAVLGVFLACSTGIAAITTWLTPRITQEIEAFQKGSSRYGEQTMMKLKTQEAKLQSAFPVFRNARLTEKALLWLKSSSEKSSHGLRPREKS